MLFAVTLEFSSPGFTVKASGCGQVRERRDRSALWVSRFFTIIGRTLCLGAGSGVGMSDGCVELSARAEKLLSTGMVGARA